MDKLKPCPFCGAPAYDHIKYLIHSHKQRHTVKCTKCNAFMEYRNKDAAIKAWNKRTTHKSETINKCGDCAYAIAGQWGGKTSNLYVECTNEEHIKKWCKNKTSRTRQRTTRACKCFREKGDGSDASKID